MERESGAKEEHQETAWETRGPAAAQVAPRGPPLEPEVLERRRPLATLETEALEPRWPQAILELEDSGLELAIREPEGAELRLEPEDSGLELASRELEDVELRPIRELELVDAELRLEPGDSGKELAIREPEHAELRLELEDNGLEPEDNGQCALGALHI